MANDSPALGLRSLFEAYVASADPDRLAVLLGALLPVLASRRRQEQALALVAAAAGCDLSFPAALLTDTGVLHSDADLAAAAIEDFTALARPGLSVAFFPGNNPAAPAARPTTRTRSPATRTTRCRQRPAAARSSPPAGAGTWQRRRMVTTTWRSPPFPAGR